MLEASQLANNNFLQMRLIGIEVFVKFRAGRLAAPRFSSLSGCLDV
ncbi:MAG TPA: hypothetical protein VMR43_04610 [Variovorax sp.]|nr:hypothetical protein [Variovorax sp.]